MCICNCNTEICVVQMNVGGQFVGFMGSAMYAYYKLRGK